MAGKPQTLSKGQQDEVSSILRKQVLTWSLIFLAVLTGVTGLSLWGIKCRVEKKMEELVAAQFQEPRIRELLHETAADRANAIIMDQVRPEVVSFKAEVQKELKGVQSTADEAKRMAEPPTLSLDSTTVTQTEKTYEVVICLKPSKLVLLGPVVLLAKVQGETETKILDFSPQGVALTGENSKKTSSDGKVARLQYQPMVVGPPKARLKISGPGAVEVQGNYSLAPFTVELK